MNEETIIESRHVFNEHLDNQKKSMAWKHITLGGVSGIFMGAGLMYASQTLAKDVESEQDSESPSGEQPEGGSLNVATLHDDLSFAEAFTAARNEVGSGGVFYWHGGIYNTYTAEEWDNMTDEQKHDFVQRVKPEIGPDQTSTPTDSHPDVAAHPAAVQEPQSQESNPEEVQAVDPHESNTVQSDDVHLVGYADYEGHLVAGYDTTGDGEVDIAIIDIDDSNDISDPDIITDTQGHVATVGEVTNPQIEDPYLTTSIEENPEATTDQPDFINDADINSVDL